MIRLESLKTKGDLANIIAAHFKLEALATYAPYNIRVAQNALDDTNYSEASNQKLMSELKNILLSSYDTLMQQPNKKLEDKDFDILNDFWSGKRIAYRFGLYSCIKIVKKYGMDFLINTIRIEPEHFIEIIRTV